MESSQSALLGEKPVGNDLAVDQLPGIAASAKDDAPILQEFGSGVPMVRGANQRFALLALLEEARITERSAACHIVFVGAKSIVLRLRFVEFHCTLSVLCTATFNPLS